MGKVKVTHSFEIEDSEYCRECNLKVKYDSYGKQYYKCLLFEENLHSCFGNKYEFMILRCPKCLAASELVKGAREHE